MFGTDRPCKRILRARWQAAELIDHDSDLFGESDEISSMAEDVCISALLELLGGKIVWEV